MDTGADVTGTNEETLPVPGPAMSNCNVCNICSSATAVHVILALVLAVMLAGVLYCSALLVRATCIATCVDDNCKALPANSSDTISSSAPEMKVQLKCYSYCSTSIEVCCYMHGVRDVWCRSSAIVRTKQHR